MTRIDLEPSAMAAGGDAIARDRDGRVVFVEGALPGERVVAELVEERRDYARARTVEVVEASPDRVAPPCRARAEGCGGCPWQHVAPAAQPRLKAEVVADSLRRIAHVDAATDGGRGVAVTALRLREPALRTTARVAVRGGRAGYRRHRSHDVVPVTTCLAAHPRLEAILTAGDFGGAREAVVRVAVATGDAAAMLEPSARGARLPAGVVVVGQRDRALAPVVEVVAGRRFRVSIRSFFQSGPVAAEALVDAVDAALAGAVGPGDRIVDAYAGVGLFGSTLAARHGARVTAIESAAAAVADARVNLADVDADIVHGEVAAWRASGGSPVAVVADPARPGLGRPGVDAVASSGAPLVVLVSCDPASLGRDAALLAGRGFTLETVAVVDSFPHTFHVETVARFAR
ncbi:MAG TPA: TRAM domain-containing protein [Acidimicrobiales bacterium]|nr:TRAM domain-containing protein [Acidimicrobiales bacterium]